MTVLYAESFAPWCEKARWALDHHRVPYREVEHIPMLGDVVLRVASRRPFGRVTVPLLVDGPEVLMDSAAIARYAERKGGCASLVPAAHEREIAAWNERSEIVMMAGRAMLLPRMSRSPDALREQLPPFVPSALRGAMKPVAAMGVAHLVRKYAIHGADALHESRSREALDALRGALAGGREHLIGDALSFADITMAASLQFVLPVAERYISLGPATRDVWTHRGLASEYRDLLAWRDTLYRTNR